MNTTRRLPRTLALLAGLAALAPGGPVAADPPSRVARLAFTSGPVSLSPAGDDDWVLASINRPLTTGDRLWVDAGARAEVQVGGAAIRLDGGTSISLLNLDDGIVQVQLAQGTMDVGVRSLRAGQLLEVDTPNLAFTIRRPGEYRIEVDPDGRATSIVVRSGQGEAYGEGAAYVVDAPRAYRFYGTGLSDYEDVRVPGPDAFDAWARDRDRRGQGSISARYVSRDVVGYEDLDAYGAWRVDPEYGNVWAPTRVAVGWSPYHDGHWAWVDPWGWTWVDDAPWGFAVSHYGRWAHTRGSWAWVPGPVRSQAVYAPALVVFVGGSNFQVSIGGGSVGAVAWFPLGPREVYRPSYPASRGYFDNVNRSNTVINNTTITNVYNDTNVTNVVYANRQVQGAVVAVPATAFVQSQPVSRAVVPLRREVIVAAPVSTVAAVAPVQQSVHGVGRAGGRPPAAALDRAVVARTAPPPAPVGFSAQERRLAAKPGQPLDEATRRELKPAGATAAPKVAVVAPARAAAPTAPPPPVAQPRDRRGNDRTGGAKAPEAGGPPAAPARAAPVPPASAAPVPAPPAQAAPVAAPRPPPSVEQRGQGQRDAQPKPAKVEKRDEPTAAPAQAAPGPPADRRGGQDSRDKPAPKEAAKPATPPPASAAPVPAPPAPAPPAAAPRPPSNVEQRGQGQRDAQPKPAKVEKRDEPTAAPAQAAPAPPADRRGGQDSRDKPGPKEAAKPATPPPAVAAPIPAPPPQAPPIAAHRPPSNIDQRGQGPRDAQPKPAPDATRNQPAAAPKGKPPQAAPDPQHGGPKADGDKGKSDEERRADEEAKKHQK